ncbi:hypothetical protein [Candidatus Protochlamydia phocaeensis]|uniref:hypothetical protein n=1 Tax=Candidatus Protochlamydia phocaeensis TaxID=1414722 RepID=UPI0008397D95|nr:hypothetical protein [Candidatus Protochlamydia phocaeensis]
MKKEEGSIWQFWTLTFLLLFSSLFRNWGKSKVRLESLSIWSMMGGLMRNTFVGSKSFPFLKSNTPYTLLPQAKQMYKNKPVNYLIRTWSQKAVVHLLSDENLGEEEAKSRLNDFLINLLKESLPTYLSHIPIN